MKETGLNMTGQNTALHKSPTKIGGNGDRRGTMMDNSLKQMTSSKKKSSTNKKKSPKKLDL